MWLSRLWTTGDKLVGTIGGLSWVAAGLGGIMTSAGGSTAVGSEPLGPTETSVLAVVVFVVPFALPVAAAIYLGIVTKLVVSIVRTEARRRWSRRRR